MPRLIWVLVCAQVILLVLSHAGSINRGYWPGNEVSGGVSRIFWAGSQEKKNYILESYPRLFYAILTFLWGVKRNLGMILQSFGLRFAILSHRLLLSHMKWLDTWTYTFPLITSAKHIVVAEAIKYLGKYMVICLILACENEAIYMWQNNILIFYINTFQRKVFTKF